jgi:glutamyl-tRNA synthetase
MVSDENLLDKVIGLVKDRCTLLTDFYDQSVFFFKTPEQYDLGAIKPKWNEANPRTANYVKAWRDRHPASQPEVR